MSKLRIYELAKELGVDNKVVLNKAIDLGFNDKTSHSSSLNSDEATQIRRSLLRQATSPEVNSGMVSERIMKGADSDLVERRVGNVIRRRKANDAPIVEAIKEELPPIVEEVPVVEEVIQEDQDEQEEVIEEIQVPDVIQEQEVVEALPSAPVHNTIQPQVRGPKILGKIELPIRKVVTKPEPEVKVVKPVKSKAQIDFEDEVSEKKKKSKRKEIVSSELVDYSGREYRKKKGGLKHRDEGFSSSSANNSAPAKPVKRSVKMGDAIVIADLARQLSVKSAEVISKLFEMGVLVNINQAVDFETASIVVEEFGGEIESTSFNENVFFKEQKDADILVDPKDLLPRPPVVTVMGHVDHGKTTLLDNIRKASVADKEHGGITQHIGAYSVEIEEKGQITFIDTPGHAAFTSMRARGAKVTDIVILVVASDDGVMPQTLEALNHAKAAEVSIVVAITKIDKGRANVDRIKQQLTEHNLQPEDWGGDTMYFGVSAITGEGVKELLEGLLLLAEVKELKANPKVRAKGTVIESRVDKGRGVVATVLVQDGTLKQGDIFVAGIETGRVRSMSNGLKAMSDVGPATPVEITGFNGTPIAGDDFIVVDNESSARELADNRKEKKALKDVRSGAVSLEEFARRANDESPEELNVILKSDVAGSMEAVREALQKQSTKKVSVKVVHSAVGGVNESDVQLAAASNAIIVAFGVRAEPRAVTEAERLGIELRFYRIIYELLDDIKSAMVGLLDPIKSEVSLGKAEVRNTFSVSKIGTIAGSYVIDGIARRGSKVRLLRDSKVVYEGKLSSLKRFKDDVKEVQTGFECGLGIENFNDVKVGDVMEFFEIKETQATLE